MGERHDFERRGPGQEPFDARRTIDVNDEEALGFWSHRLGVPREEIVEAVKSVGPNATAVLLKLDAPQSERVAPPTIPPR